MKTLTPRELEVARLVSSGLRTREVAETLGIKTGTAKLHLYAIYRKLGVSCRIHMMHRWMDHVRETTSS
jgi:two-component system nitrate/nitrite response regulator NarL